MESNHRPSLAGTVFKTACAPCAPSSVVGAERIELPTSCSQSKRATAALRPGDGCWQTGDFWAPRGSLFQTSLPTQKPTGRAFRSASLPCPAGRSYCRRYVHRPMDAAYSGPVGFCVGPRLSGVSCLLSPGDLSRNRTAPRPTKPRQTSRNRTGTFFVGGRR